jgi:hypothetical protein
MGNIIVGLEEIRCEGVDWIKLAEDTIQWRDTVKMVMDLPVS